MRCRFLVSMLVAAAGWLGSDLVSPQLPAAADELARAAEERAPATDADWAPAWLHAHWRVRDVAAATPLMPADAADGDGLADPLGLRLEVTRNAGAGGWSSRCTCLDLRGQDRALTLACCVDLDAIGGTWWDDPQAQRPITQAGAYANEVDVSCGATGTASRYPLAVVACQGRAFCLAVPPEPPRMVRFVYDAGQRELRAEFDLGVSPVPEQFPSRADASVIAFEVAPRWAFRRALAEYYARYPEVFQRRVGAGGLWLPFQALETIQGPQDFGFAFREVALQDLHTVAQDEQLGVGSFVYCEPQTNWRTVRGTEQPTYDLCMAQLKEDAEQGDARARATLVSGVERADGRYDMYLGPVAWTQLVPLGVNADPAVPAGGALNKAQFELDQLASALGWKSAPSVGLDGVYIDSLEGWGLLLNYRREHWRVSQYPLTFDPATHRVALLNFWGTYAFVQELSARLRAQGLALMGNDAFFRLWFLVPYIDIPGREYAWLENGNWTPVPEPRWLFFRSMAAGRPYLMLMNNDYASTGQRMSEYFEQCLFYAVYPSAFHGHSSLANVPYFSNPSWYNRDRHLFVKYLPLIRKLDAAGWEPVPCAAAEPETMRVERYGTVADGDLAFTVHNPTDAAQPVALSLLRNELGLGGEVQVVESIHQWPVTVQPAEETVELRFDLPPRGYAMLSCDVTQSSASAAPR